MNPSFKVGDIAVALSNGQEQTEPLEIKQITRENGRTFYKLNEQSPILWETLAPGDKLTHALVHLRLGWSVFPLEKDGKRPAITGTHSTTGKALRFGWKKYQGQKAQEPTVKSWHQRWPDMNHAIVTGAISGIVVLDIDGPEGEQYAKDHGLPPTPTATTGKGRHVFFKHPGGIVKNTVRKVPGLDFRGDGGYVVGVGSWHGEKQKTYRWTISPWDVPLAYVPDWVMDLLKEPPKPDAPQPTHRAVDPIRKAEYWKHGLQNAARMIREAVDGEKHSVLLKASRLLGGYIGGGIGNEQDAVKLLEFEISQKPNVRSFELAQQDIRDGISHGRQEAITYDMLETDREAYFNNSKLPPLPVSGDALESTYDSLLNAPAVQYGPQVSWCHLIFLILLFTLVCISIIVLSCLLVLSAVRTANQ